eukprot:TRINITY_DN40300_c0_g1_i1.p2 TRINITY_DN40300_c0_g1~~TRINITY_DN40300_c0_g1_i1.p2  ORF type:complete len:125 (-),score=28.08 TRINITY_DN40300_c0_g1_i1:114-488(-)
MRLRALFGLACALSSSCASGLVIDDSLESTSERDSVVHRVRRLERRPAELLQRSDEDGCCFRIGYGSMMVPCCLTTQTGKTEAECINPSQGEKIVGGAIGWKKSCPETADDAQKIIEASQTTTT